MSKKDRIIENLKSEIAYLKSGNVKSEPGWFTLIRKKDQTSAVAINIHDARLADIETVIINGQSFAGYNYRLSTEELQEVVDGQDYIDSINWGTR